MHGVGGNQSLSIYALHRPRAKTVDPWQRGVLLGLLAKTLAARALAALVRCVEDERCSASFPHAFPAVLRVTTRTGEELEARVEVNRGGPGNPRSDEELARKFHDNAVRSLPEERGAEIAARTLALPDAQSVEDLTALLTSAGER